MLDGVILTIDNLDLSQRLLTYSVTQEIKYKKVVTTLNGIEHPYPALIRPIINFTLMPATEKEDAELYEILEKIIFEVKYIEKGVEVTRKMRLISNLEALFLLKSVDGNVRYKQGNIQLRGL